MAKRPRECSCAAEIVKNGSRCRLRLGDGHNRPHRAGGVPPAGDAVAALARGSAAGGLFRKAGDGRRALLGPPTAALSAKIQAQRSGAFET
ncbi:MAG: hypothetical protein V4564_19880, partial [Pseudomonadota bacterium]